MALPLEERAKRMARQGFSYTTADGVRVVYQTEGENLKDVPRDGKTIGEIVVRGNLVMREVDASQIPPPFFGFLTFLSDCTVFRR
jgi:hypothetical protein